MYSIPPAPPNGPIGFLPRPGRSPRRPLSIWGILLLAIACVLTIACAPGTPPEEVDRSEIETFLEGYLPMLGEAYGQADPSRLEGLAVPKEQARIELRIEELAAQGQVYEPTFVEVTVEDVSVWNYSNAFATTLEVWDVRAFTTGSRMLVNESVGQRSRVKYQLKRKDDSWVVLFRELEQTFDS